MNLHRLVCLATQMRGPYNHVTGMEIEAGDIPKLRMKYNLGSRNVSRARYVMIPAGAGSGAVDIRYVRDTDNPDYVVGMSDPTKPRHVFKLRLERAVRKMIRR